MPEESKGKQNLAIYSALVGCIGTLAVLPFQHPLDVIKANWQTNSQLKHELEVFNFLKVNKGLKGFYSGFVTNCMRQGCKSLYRYPLVAYLPRFYSNMLGIKYENHKYLNKLLTSLTITLLEACVLTPFERIQVFAMTSQVNKNNYRDLLGVIRSNSLRELYKGFWPYYTKQLVSWTFWLQADTFFKNQARWFWSIPEDQKVTGSKLALCTVLVSIATTLVAMPFDNIKTHLQKHYKNLDLIKDGEEKLKAKGGLNIKQSLKSIYTRGGVLGFFVGWRLKLMVYFLSSAVASTILEHLDFLSRSAFKK